MLVHLTDWALFSHSGAYVSVFNCKLFRSSRILSLIRNVKGLELTLRIRHVRRQCSHCMWMCCRSVCLLRSLCTCWSCQCSMIPQMVHIQAMAWIVHTRSLKVRASVWITINGVQNKLIFIAWRRQLKTCKTQLPMTFLKCSPAINDMADARVHTDGYARRGGAS